MPMMRFIPIPSRLAAGGRVGALPAAVRFGAARFSRVVVHPRRDGPRASGPRLADRDRAGTSRRRGSVGRVWRCADGFGRKQAPRGARAERDGPAVDVDRSHGRVWPHRFGGRRDPCRRRQYRGLHPHDDNGDRAGNQQGRPAAGARTGARADRAHRDDQRRRVRARRTVERMRRIRLWLSAFVAAWVWLPNASAAEMPANTILLATTTSLDNSGLLGALLPIFTRETGIEVHVLAQGTGQALDTARRGDADLVLVHDPDAEEQFIAEGHGVNGRQIAWNDFVIVGPTADPAHIAGGHDAGAALNKIAGAKAAFVSRGDRSGTHALELRLWQMAAIDPKNGAGTWYRD